MSPVGELAGDKQPAYNNLRLKDLHKYHKLGFITDLAIVVNEVTSNSVHGDQSRVARPLFFLLH